MGAARTGSERSAVRLGDTPSPTAPVALVGWSHAAAAARARVLGREGRDVLVVDDVLEAGFDALTESIAGRDLVVGLMSAADSPWPWVAALDAIAVVRLALAQTGGRVTLVTETEVLPAEADDDDAAALDVWVDDARRRAVLPCPPWRVADLCRALVPEGTSVDAARALAVAASVRALGRLVPAEQFESLVEPIAPELARAPMDPPLRVAPPPRPFRPDVVADRQQQALWDGCLKYGNQWSQRLEQMLDDVLQLGPDRRVVVTASGTDALRLAVAAVAPVPAPGATAILPSFTFPATAEVLVQLGYALRFVDVDPSGWTLDPVALERALDRARADVVVVVDTMGNPARYDELVAVCAAHGVPLVADSAAALGSLYRGHPVGTQAGAHAFSMSFAKAVSAGGAGGAVVVPAGADLPVRSGWPRNAMSELHAIAGVDQLEILPALMRQRGAVRDVYEALVQRHDGLASQAVVEGDRHAWGFWVMRVGAGLRAGLQTYLAAAGIETKVYYPALHLSGWDGTDEGLTVSAALDAEALALPMSSELTVARAARVAAAVDRFMTEAQAPAP